MHRRKSIVADFIGSTNFVEATVRGVDGNAVALEVFERTLTVPKPEHNVSEGQVVKLVLRPEAMQVVDREGQYQGVIRWSSYLGSSVEYVVEVVGQRLTVVDNDPRNTVVYPQGHEVGVQMLEDCLYILPE